MLPQNALNEVVLQILVVLVIILFTSCLLLFCAVMPLFLLWRTVVVKLATFLHPQLHKLVPSSAVALACDSLYTNPTWNLVGFMILDGIMDFEKLRDDSWTRIINKKKTPCNSKKMKGSGNDELLYPEFQQSLAQFGGYLFWKWDENFDLKNHVRYYDYEGDLALPTSKGREGKGKYCTEEDLERVYGGLLSKPWIEGRSMWEFLYIGNFKSVHTMEEKEQCIVAYRIHHSMADGYSIIKMLQDLSNVEINHTKDKNKYPKLSTWQKILYYVIFPFKLSYDVSCGFVDFFDGFNSWHLLTTKLSREYNSCISKPLPVELIKRIKNQHDVSYNAVLCAASSGGFCKLMKDAGQEIPWRISSFFAFPLPNHPEGLGVHASSIALKLPMASNSCLERLHLVNKGIRKSKYYFGHYFYPILGIGFGIAPIVVTRKVCNIMCQTVIMSCLPGPEKPMEFGGAKMTDALNSCGAGYGKNAITMILMSICGTQRFVAHIDKTVFPSQEIFSRLGQYIEEELNLMLNKESVEYLTRG